LETFTIPLMGLLLPLKRDRNDNFTPSVLSSRTSEMRACSDKPEKDLYDPLLMGLLHFQNREIRNDNLFHPFITPRTCQCNPNVFFGEIFELYYSKIYTIFQPSATQKKLTNVLIKSEKNF
jgi:hypothetical protein